MISGTILYRKSNGNEVIYTKTENNMMLGAVRTKDGYTYPEQSVASIIARGYWDSVYEEVEKHGTHDQKTHGNWATGETVSDINKWNSAELDKFASPEEHEKYLLDNILSQRLAGFTGREFHSSVSLYQSMTGYTVNEALRDPQISEDGVAGLIKDMDSAIEAAPPLASETTVYRGIKGNGLDFFEALKAGDVFQDKGFVSTTLDTDVARRFSVQGDMYQGIVMRMKLPAGTKGLYPTSVTGLSSMSSREAEFVLPRDSKFKVLNNQGKVWDVELVND